MPSFPWWMPEPEVIMNRFRQCWPMAGRVTSAIAFASSVAASSMFLAAPALASAGHPDGPWSAQKQVPRIASSRSPALCTSGKHLYVAYTASGGGIDYISRTSSWSSKVSKVSGTDVHPSTNLAPAITVYQGHLYVFWTSKSGQVSYTHLAAKKWAKTKKVSGTWGTAESSAAPSVTVAQGVLVAAWKGRSTHNVYYSLGSDTSWSSQLVAVKDATSFGPSVAPTGLSAAPVAIAWTASSGAIGYGLVSFLGFEHIGTVPQAGTNAAPSLDFMAAAPEGTMYVSWKGTSTSRVFFDEVPNFADSSFGPSTWTGQASLPGALTSTGPAIANEGTTLYAAYRRSGTREIWYQRATTPTS
jgi:hypothetical protein